MYNINVNKENRIIVNIISGRYKKCHLAVCACTNLINSMYKIKTVNKNQEQNR